MKKNKTLDTQGIRLYSFTTNTIIYVNDLKKAATTFLEIASHKFTGENEYLNNCQLLLLRCMCTLLHLQSHYRS